MQGSLSESSLKGNMQQDGIGPTKTLPCLCLGAQVRPFFWPAKVLAFLPKAQFRVWSTWREEVVAHFGSDYGHCPLPGPWEEMILTLPSAQLTSLWVWITKSACALYSVSRAMYSKDDQQSSVELNLYKNTSLQQTVRFSKENAPWLLWLSGLSAGLQTKGSLV